MEHLKPCSNLIFAWFLMHFLSFFEKSHFTFDHIIVDIRGCFFIESGWFEIAFCKFGSIFWNHKILHLSLKIVVLISLVIKNYMFFFEECARISKQFFCVLFVWNFLAMILTLKNFCVCQPMQTRTSSEQIKKLKKLQRDHDIQKTFLCSKLNIEKWKFKKTWKKNSCNVKSAYNLKNDPLIVNIKKYKMQNVIESKKNMLQYKNLI